MTIAGLRVCSQCAHMNPPNARFCNQCGKAIASEQEPSQYTPRHLSEKILKTRSAMEGERKQVTVLFVDIKGSVALSQQVEAEHWHQIMDRFFSILTECIHDYEGTINQYTGDGVMALFGAPLAHEDHAERACRAALAIRQRLLVLAEELKQQDGLNFAARQGLNSGEVVVGRIGDDLRMDYTAQGQTVGLAARMEQLAHANGILMSRFTQDLVAGEFRLKERSAVSVSGFDERVRTYELLAVAQQAEEYDEDQPLLGRNRELSLLESYRRKVETSACGMLVTISADTGLGKSRLCREFIRQTEAKGVRCYSVRGSSHHRVETQQPLQQLLIALLDLPQADDEHFAALLNESLEQYRPLPQWLEDNLYQLFELAPEQAQEIENNRQIELGLQLALRLLHEGVLKQHAVFIVENLHWLDDPRASAFLDAAIKSIPHLPVLFVATARQDYQFRWHQQSFVRNINLQALSEVDSHNLLDHLLGDHDELDGLKAELVQRAGGNPLFLSELVNQLFDAGVLSAEARGARLKKADHAIQLPPSIQAVVAARVDSLSDSAKHLLQIAAVIGRRVPLDLLQMVYQGKDLDQALGLLLEQGFLHREVSSHNALLFSQTLFQDVTYGALLNEQRRELHRQVARALCSRVGGATGAAGLHLARHLVAAGQAKEAADQYLSMADRSARHDIAEAHRRLEMAADSLAQLPDSEQARNAQLRILARRLQVGVRRSMDANDLSDLLHQGEEWVENGVDDASHGLFLLGCGSMHLAAGEHAAAAVCFAGALDFVSAQPGECLAARVPMSYSRLLMGDLSRAEQEAAEALAELKKLGVENDVLQRADAWLNASCEVSLRLIQAWALLWQGRMKEARKCVDQALKQAQSQKYGEQKVMSLAASAFLAGYEGDQDKANEQARQAVSLARGMRNLTAELFAYMAFGRSVLLQQEVHQDWPEAITSLEEVIARCSGRGFGLGELARLEADLSKAYLASGDARAARDLAAQAGRRAEAASSSIPQIEAHMAQLRAGLHSRKPFAFLKRYRSQLDELENTIDAASLALLKPEFLLLKARLFELRQDSEQAELLRDQAAQTAAQLGLKAFSISA